MQLVEPIWNKDKIEQVKRILKERGTRDLLLFVLGINTGLRISDILKLKVFDVKNKNYIEIKEQKTGKAKKCPILNGLKNLLDEYIMDKSDKTFLFESRKGGKITRVQAYRIINAACKKADIHENIGTHTLRKTFGYHFYNQTKDVALLQTILNHSAPSVTLRYIGLNQDIIDNSLRDFSL